MSTFLHSVQDFVSAYYTQPSQDLPTIAQTIIQEADNVTPEECTWGLLSLVEFALQDAVPQKMIASWVCGYLTLRGGSAWVALGPLIECLQEVLEGAGGFVASCREVSQEPISTPLSQQEVEKFSGVFGTEKPELFWSYTSVIPVLGVSLPLIEYFQDARMMLRSNENLAAQLEELKDHHEPIKDLLEILSRKANDDANAVSAATRVAAAITKFEALAADAEVEPETFETSRQAVIRELLCVPLRVRDDALRQLAGSMEKAHLRHVGELIYTCGSIVETGGDPRIAFDAAVSRLPEMLTATSEFVELCLTAAELDGKDTNELDHSRVVETYAARVLEKRNDADAGWQTIGRACLGIIAMLSRAVDIRQRFCGEEGLIRQLAGLGQSVPQAVFLWKMLRVLDDEELVILAPEQQRGWKVQIRGVADNFQLHTLIAGNLVGDPEDGWVAGVVGTLDGSGEGHEPEPNTPLDARMTGVSRYLPFAEGQVRTIISHLNFWTWEGLREDGKLPDNAIEFRDFLVYNEGLPGDIPALGDVRVVLLGSSNYWRSWNGGRVFSGMKADMRILETLTPEGVDEWLARIIAKKTN